MESLAWKVVLVIVGIVVVLGLFIWLLLSKKAANRERLEKSEDVQEGSASRDSKSDLQGITVKIWD
ncbi:MAG: hypothetical protein ACLTKE_03930 [Coprococcus sp.]